MALPEFVKVCPRCGGAGKRNVPDEYLTCRLCERPGDWPHPGAGYLYKATGKPVPTSVVAQIRNATE